MLAYRYLLRININIKKSKHCLFAGSLFGHFLFSDSICAAIFREHASVFVWREEDVSFAIFCFAISTRRHVRRAHTHTHDHCPLNANEYYYFVYNVFNDFDYYLNENIIMRPTNIHAHTTKWMTDRGADYAIFCMEPIMHGT